MGRPWKLLGNYLGIGAALWIRFELFGTLLGLDWELLENLHGFLGLLLTLYWNFLTTFLVLSWHFLVTSLVLHWYFFGNYIVHYLILFGLLIELFLNYYCLLWVTFECISLSTCIVNKESILIWIGFSICGAWILFLIFFIFDIHLRLHRLEENPDVTYGP